jgi:methionyl-tRNA formyltransferase
MGTPEFAVEPLRAILNAGFDVAAIVTAPDKPAGRGLALMPSAVKRFAEERNLRILQPEKLKDEFFIEQLREINADIQVVVAFRMLPEIIWSMPRLGTFNLHASLLPHYRGAAPINWAIINGDKETGVTTFFIEHEIDTGKIIFQEKIPILPEDNIGTVYKKLMHIGSQLVVKTLNTIEAGNYPQIPQQIPADGILKPAPKIFTETCHIQWSKATKDIHNLVRGLSPYPAAFTTLVSENKNISLKIFETTYEQKSHQFTPGTLVTDGKNYLNVAANDGFVSLLSVQAQGKKRLPVGDFLRGMQHVNDFHCE